MAMVKYVGEPGGTKDTEQYGYEFAGGKAVEVTDEAHLRKFRGNPHFEVDEKEVKLPVKGGKD